MHEAVLPTPGGPVSSRWGGSAVEDDAESASLILFGTARSSKVLGENTSNQLGIVLGRRAGS